MRCEAVVQVLPGYVGRDLLPATAASVQTHLDSCAPCRSAREALDRVAAGMAALSERQIEPPAMLADVIIQQMDVPTIRRVLPVPLLPPNELVRLLGENRDAIASAAGAAFVVAGAAWILWRAADRRSRPVVAAS